MRDFAHSWLRSSGLPVKGSAADQWPFKRCQIAIVGAA